MLIPLPNKQLKYIIQTKLLLNNIFINKYLYKTV